MSARVLMVQGTASSVGKSLITAALCRIYAERGLRVAPFKSQNMALNSFVTRDGHEIGRAQAVQAEAAGQQARVAMNPILLKAEGEGRCQVVLMGKPIGHMSAAAYHEQRPRFRRTIVDCLAELRADNDVVIIEGAGSPAEINLKDRDIANMYVAELADAPVVLVADIDRGGVFASLVGTMELLDASERARVAGFVINKFRGDASQLHDGLEFLHRRTGAPVLGVVPFLRDLGIADEDSTELGDRSMAAPGSDDIDIVVVHLPHVSNYDDVLPLEREPGVRVRFVQDAQHIKDADLVILPGSKSTVSDLAWLRDQGIADALLRRARQAKPILGICGGYQMLGKRIDDPDAVESATPSTPGLALLELTTRFEPTKTTTQVVAATRDDSYLASDQPITGYEIHMGRTTTTGPSPFSLTRRNDDPLDVADGALSDNGAVVGTMIHGILDNDGVRAGLLHHLRPQRTHAPVTMHTQRRAAYDRLAASVRASIDMTAMDNIIFASDSRNTI